MKKIFFSIVALAALAACTKSEVAYEAPQEIGFAPTVKNVTKAAMTGDLSTANPDQQLGIWAYWNYDGSALLTSHTVSYLNDATFGKKDATLANGSLVTAWGGVGYAYPWPTNGTLKFAGYTKPAAAESVTYSGVEDNEIIFTNYTQTAGYDLCWFETTEAYNNRTSGEAIPVTLSHALSWLTFKIQGQGTEGWKINSIVLNDIASKGTGVCSGNGADAATWTCTTYETDMTLRSTELVLTDEFVDIENDAKNFLVIPQTLNAGGQDDASRTQHTLTINYSFPVGDPDVSTNWKTDNITVKLDLASNYGDAGTDEDPVENRWKSGVHYTYNLTFKTTEILVAPSYDGWEDVDQSVTVE
ncbi:MAG: fimbrillin family protein [Bacteroidales bacterium]|nr:fimbrillin family protein [Bacteroidales bacterium]